MKDSISWFKHPAFVIPVIFSIFTIILTLWVISLVHLIGKVGKEVDSNGGVKAVVERVWNGNIK